MCLTRRPRRHRQKPPRAEWAIAWRSGSSCRVWTWTASARRLHTVMERLLDEISFDAPDRFGASVTIDEAYVNRMLAEVVANDDLSRYIL